MKRTYLIVFSSLLLAIVASCTSTKTIKEKTDCTKIKHLEWSRQAVIYEVNLRQYTNEGTIKSFERHLPQLKKLGVDILWFMPVYPISEKNRKGELGSYYAIQNYKAINPEYGSIEEFKEMVKKAHQLGFKVILDWVANHTGCDNVWVEQHPDWYVKDSIGNFVGPYDWTDTYKLDYSNKEMRKGMIDAMSFWVKHCNIDGFRCDVAFEVPVDFWETARTQLDSIKPIFMLAEAENRELSYKSFDMLYNWPIKDVTNQIAKGGNAKKAEYIHESLSAKDKSPIKTAADIDIVLAKQDSIYPCDVYLMNFITNHDENSWAGTEFERLGDGVKAFAVLAYTLNGMPLIYTGQEVGFNHRFKFFAKDIAPTWEENDTFRFYQKLNQLKHSQQALAAGKNGGKMIRYQTSNDKAVYVFSRQLDKKNEVLVMLNLTPNTVNINFIDKTPKGKFKNYFDDTTFSFDDKGATISMKPWEYRVYVK